ncbi:diacylglycerol/lipid kinase family protein [Nonlabens agnitus]|uniref:DAGKc domain-containing protein n=1 Tax=Nonlabens agnitus TaxID=870484 RepID=A0A2S9WVU9_9FLAO|nr:diacylglycerol kinase family protein [Nonlabens agnitus]PRP67486.1 hypothetical protein BST86_10460 [Nonlabens agnitus]
MNTLSSQDKLLLIVNPIAGGTDKAAYVDTVKKLIEHRWTLEVFYTTGENDASSIKDVIDNYQPDRIMVMGGDGTIKLAAEIVTNKIPIAILPAGSSNGLATDLDIPMEESAAIQIALGSNAKVIDTLYINDGLGLHISDIGLNAELIREYDSGTIRGHLGYALQVIPTLWKSETPCKFKIITKDETREVTAVMVAFANSKKFGTGVTVNPNSSMEDGYFEVLIFKNLDPIDVVKTMMGSIPLDSEFVEIIKTQEAIVTTEKPVSFQIDGEYCSEKTKVKVSILPGNLCVMVP